MRPIRGFLADFSAVAPPPDLAPALEAPDPAVLQAAREAALVAAARAEGVAAGRREAEAEALDRHRSLVEEHQAAIEAARAAWVAGEGPGLAGALREGLATLEASLGSELAGVLEPLVLPATRERALHEVKAAVARLVSGAEGLLVEVRGPGDLLDAIRIGLGEHAAVQFTASDDVAVVVEAGDTTLRTQLHLWGERFEKALLVSP